MTRTERRLLLGPPALGVTLSLLAWAWDQRGQLCDRAVRLLRC